VSSSITHPDLVEMRTNLVGGYMGSMLYGKKLFTPLDSYIAHQSLSHRHQSTSYIAAVYFLLNRKNKRVIPVDNIYLCHIALCWCYNNNQYWYQDGSDYPD
jgi:hypothetical protein